MTLSYLAWGFDWQANYVATLRPGGQSADLIAWVTLASSDTTSFVQAETMVVAGKVKREDSAPYYGGRRDIGGLTLHCFAHPGPPLPIPEESYAEEIRNDIVVTGSRLMAVPAPAPPALMVVQEDFGDLKLYRVPDRTTVAALAQKQVALLEKPAVPVRVVYVAKVSPNGMADRPRITLRWLNRKEAGLGVPLPAGPVAVFQLRGGTSLLIGEGAIRDKAIGEEVEAPIADATQVTIESANPESGAGWRDHVLTARNANPYPVNFEVQFALEEQPRMSQLTGNLTRREGKLLWSVELPANGTRTFGYRRADRN